jgi:hypothetical protein
MVIMHFHLKTKNPFVFQNVKSSSVGFLILVKIKKDSSENRTVFHFLRKTE